MTRLFFQNLFTRDDYVNPDVLMTLVEERVTSNMNDQLYKEFSEEEIGDALFQIGPLKAPGPDGFPARFFQQNWKVMKDEVVHAVREFFRPGIMPEGVNESAIVLIPKIELRRSYRSSGRSAYVM